MKDSHQIVVSAGKYGFVIHEHINGSLVKRVTDKVYPQRGVAFTVASAVANTYGAAEVVMPPRDFHPVFALNPCDYGTQFVGGEDCADVVMSCAA